MPMQQTGELGVGLLKKKKRAKKEGGWGAGWRERERNGPVSRKACPTNALHRGPKLPPIQ